MRSRLAGGLVLAGASGRRRPRHGRRSRAARASRCRTRSWNCSSRSRRCAGRRARGGGGGSTLGGAYPADAAGPCARRRQHGGAAARPVQPLEDAAARPARPDRRRQQRPPAAIRCTEQADRRPGLQARVAPPAGAETLGAPATSGQAAVPRRRLRPRRPAACRRRCRRCWSRCRPRRRRRPPPSARRNWCCRRATPRSPGATTRAAAADAEEVLTANGNAPRAYRRAVPAGRGAGGQARLFRRRGRL